MIGNQPRFLELVTPPIRKVLVSERLAAMRGRVEDVCKRLKMRGEELPVDNHPDIAAIGLLRSELLYLNEQSDEALAVFRQVVLPQQSALPMSAQLVITDNLTVLQFEESPKEGFSTFYHLVDRRRVIGFESSEKSSLLEAQFAIENDKLASALPLLWQNLVNAHEIGSWRESRWAAERLATLYLKAGELEKACYYLFLTEDSNGVENFASAVIHRGDPDIIRTILHRLVQFTNLRRHFSVACKFVANIPDVIPDDIIDLVAEWLLPRCREDARRNGGGVMRASWEAVREIGYRTTPRTARNLIDIATSHSEWHAPIPDENRVLPNRKAMIEAVTFLAQCVPKEYLSHVADATLPLATERVQGNDYFEVVNLLFNLDRLGDEQLRAKLKSTLYVPGKPLTRVLIQFAGLFGVDPFGPVHWENFAKKMIEETRHTVQRLSPGEEARSVDEVLMTLTEQKENGQLKVFVQSGIGLDALNRGKQYLSDTTIDQVIRVLVEMATDTDNLLSNVEQLLSQLCGFADRASSDVCDEVVRKLEPLFRGYIPAFPLSQARLRYGSPEQVQATALVAGAVFCGKDKNRARILNEALVESFVSEHAMVRRGAYAAARRLPDFSNEQLLPLLLGLRDREVTAAVAAFAAFAERKEWPLTRPMWKMFLLAVRFAIQSHDVNLRRHAAIALRERAVDAPTEQIRSDVDAILSRLSSDVAYSVREAVKSAASGLLRYHKC